MRLGQARKSDNTLLQSGWSGFSDGQALAGEIDMSDMEGLESMSVDNIKLHNASFQTLFERERHGLAWKESETRTHRASQVDQSVVSNGHGLVVQGSGNILNSCCATGICLS